MMYFRLKLNAGGDLLKSNIVYLRSRNLTFYHPLLLSAMTFTCRYQEYKTEYISTQKRAYFEAHKDEDW